jgi:dTDP-4-dehydrorhamnose reductase
MLGTDVVQALTDAGQQVRAVGSAELDVRDAAACQAAVRDVDVVVNCSAYTAVDAAETDESAAFAVNAVGAANLAKACAATGATLVHISTDYVFDGSASEPYAADDPIAPRSAYGRTKAAGEWAARAEHGDVLVVRTAWLYGAHGGCFPRTIAKALTQRDTLDVVADQIGQPTWTVDVARIVLGLVAAGAAPGTYHATSSGQVSWHGFAQAVAEESHTDPARVRETTSEAFVRPAPRPAYSVLSHDSLRAAGVAPIADWRERFAAAAPSVLAAAAS